MPAEGAPRVGQCCDKVNVQKNELIRKQRRKKPTWCYRGRKERKASRRGQATRPCGGRRFCAVEASRGHMEGFVGFYSKCDGKLLGSSEQGTWTRALIFSGSL